MVKENYEEEEVLCSLISFVFYYRFDLHDFNFESGRRRRSMESFLQLLHKAKVKKKQKE